MTVLSHLFSLCQQPVFVSLLRQSESHLGLCFTGPCISSGYVVFHNIRPTYILTPTSSNSTKHVLTGTAYSFCTLSVLFVNKSSKCKDKPCFGSVASFTSFLIASCSTVNIKPTVIVFRATTESSGSLLYK